MREAAAAIFTRHQGRLGTHDENISFDELAARIGAELARSCATPRCAVHGGTRVRRSHGIIIADTKFEFGLDEDGRLRLMDEVLTPIPPLLPATSTHRHLSAQLRQAVRS